MVDHLGSDRHVVPSATLQGGYECESPGTTLGGISRCPRTAEHGYRIVNGRCRYEDGPVPGGGTGSDDTGGSGGSSSQRDRQLSLSAMLHLLPLRMSPTRTEMDVN